MAIFHASKRFYFGVDHWARFELVPGSEPAVYAFETQDPAVIDRLASVEYLTRVDSDPTPAVAEEPKPKARKTAQPSKRPKAAEQSNDDSSAAGAVQTVLEDVQEGTGDGS
ncbi:hypothetical protein SEA_WHITTY_9 [Mycobacterium phage Whitty]|uniref:Uncharacterized protein n=1 Tax=Mycobacterium phage Whitty TaxID=2686466 RepID=A0A6B9LVD8_9CAUD|nr:hypothetical protein SEA_WHITTY_9 [Mycobacterium phage Whitty]